MARELQVELRGVRKKFGAAEVIRGVDLGVEPGEFVVFVGPSGCGKSTLLRLIAGLEEITSGDLLIEGRSVKDLSPAKRGISMVFQSYALYPHLTVEENMGFGLKQAKVEKSEIKRQVTEAAEMLRLSELLQRKPRQLSGGQRQRVAIGRAIVRDPKVFLFDEPLSNLDAALRAQMRIEIARLHRDMDATMIYVTHDQTEAMTLADRIVVLNEGRIEQVGTPLELYGKPKTRFVASFIGSPQMNFLPVRVAGASEGGPRLKLPNGVEMAFPEAPAAAIDRDDVVLGIRPHEIKFSREKTEGIAAEIVVVETFGNHTLLYANIGEDDLVTVETAGISDVTTGERVWLSFDPAHCHFFDGDGQAL
ncbi:ABC transporter ATP-binding protein [Afifella marina]|uniref:Multiple sugar transport system ATP-binding protein n=1 Tax=Afifella marina DSM 2698 TaxID=1120955 RepID=A0A1G5NV01_AFIMA|nr:sn-glycerol-3-phosphate ABC transporter ATP-binding protein UgpC [Afifella marina]MBK1624057.1 sn-glycerol-3-phosphate ABC transporter ATP-binding protein UgpC [Afifella marina DSM 2698]MBK1627614.1 sn-glycerol-3-phosphate ABC transporter ATP-binding protein UgpC [Afifella marina]MBK5916338.1 hypothetical protein [Afifella marina]RAI21015.1 hypothetical protein CH311_08165 [Afifella marina DSM 2698]SCZ41186.1 multiple sugar transport system ATP-binding protein [Afifella marina DSM 2698]